MCGKDYSYDDFTTLHHEMGHTVYQMAYRGLHFAFRDGANNGFHEAIGELMAMVAATPSYLHQIGILEELVEDDEADVNYLLRSVGIWGRDRFPGLLILFFSARGAS